jgi:hypothetical protein
MLAGPTGRPRIAAAKADWTAKLSSACPSPFAPNSFTSTTPGAGPPSVVLSTFGEVASAADPGKIPEKDPRIERLPRLTGTRRFRCM